MRLITVVAASLCLLVGHRAYATAISISSEIDLVAHANAGGGGVTDSSNPNQLATLNALNASVNALAVNGNATVNTIGNAAATWTNSDAGAVQFNDVGWNVHSVPFGEADFTPSPFHHAFSYTFTASTSGALTMNWNITTDARTTDSFGLNGFGVGLSSLTDGTVKFQLLNLDSSGTLTWTLAAGKTYDFFLDDEANIIGALGDRFALMDAQFNWHIDSGATAPEPTTVVLFGSGIAALGARRWRNRRQQG